MIGQKRRAPQRLVRHSLGPVVRIERNGQALPPAPGRPGARKRALIVYDKLNLYRIPFTNLLRDRLAAEGVDLQVVYGFAEHDYAMGAEREARQELRGASGSTPAPCASVVGSWPGSRACLRRVRPTW